MSGSLQQYLRGGSPGIKRGGSGVDGNVGSASNGIQLYEWSY